MLNILCFHYRGVCLQSLVGELRSHVPWGMAKVIKKIYIYIYWPCPACHGTHTVGFAPGPCFRQGSYSSMNPLIPLLLKKNKN